jgi:hypothetical protein
LERDDSTCAALDAGVQDILRDLNSSATRHTMRLMAQGRGNRGLAFREGLRDLVARVPEYEQRLIDLHLDLGVFDPTVVAKRTAKEINECIPKITGRLAATLRGADAVGARRDAMLFGAEISSLVSGVTQRALVAIEIRHR